MPNLPRSRHHRHAFFTWSISATTIRLSNQFEGLYEQPRADYLARRPHAINLLRAPDVEALFAAHGVPARLIPSRMAGANYSGTVHPWWQERYKDDALFTQLALVVGSSRLTVLHVISGLGTGGAEAMLLQVAGALQAKGMPQHVVSVTDRGRSADEFEARGITVTALDVKSVIGGLRGALRLARLIEQLQPRVVQGWMYHGDLMALFAHAIARGRAGRRLYWNLRASNMDRGPIWLVVAADRISLALARSGDRQFPIGRRLSHRLGLSSPPS